MSGITLTDDDLRQWLGENAPSYYTEERLAVMTYNDLIYARTLVLRELEKGVTDPFAPGKEKKPAKGKEPASWDGLVGDPDIPSTVEMINHPRYGWVDSSRIAQYEAADRPLDPTQPALEIVSLPVEGGK